MDSKTEPASEAKEFTNVPKDSSKNWTEDYPHENGMYQNRCCECKELFFGHKRRVICKECFNKPIDWEKLALKQPPKEIKNNAWPGCWADGEMTGFARCMVKEVKPLQEEITRLKAENEELGKMYANASAKLRDLQKEYSDTKANLHRAYNGLENYKQVKAELERERELRKELVAGLKRCHGNMTLNVPSAQRVGYKEWISCREYIVSLIEKAKN